MACRDSGGPFLFTDPTPLMLRIELNQAGDFALHFRYDPSMIETIKGMTGRKYDPRNKCWTLPRCTESANHIQWLTSELGFELTDEAALTAAELRGEARGHGPADAAPDIPLKCAAGAKLFPYQREGVHYAMRKRRCLIADEMGLGKTPQALCFIEEVKGYPAVIVCPASLKHNWAREAKRWLPEGRRVRVIESSADFNFAAMANYVDVLIINYDLLAKSRREVDGKKVTISYWVAEAIKVAFNPETVVPDEGHYCKNPETKRAQACTVLAKGVKNVLVLTGTPILNRPIELAGPLKILGRLKDFGGYIAFAKRYCNAKKGHWGWDFKGASNLPELNRILRENCYIRRRKVDVLADLPPKTVRSVYLPIDNRTEYQDIEKATLQELELEDNGAQALVTLGKLKRAACRGKMKAAIEWVQEFVDAGEKLVVFGWHKETIQVLEEHFGPKLCARLDGDTKPADRDKAVQRFQTDKECLLFLGNIQAAGVGHTLTAASNVVFMEFAWTPGEHQQAEDRVHRIGQHSAVTCWYLVAEGTVEDSILELLGRKQAVIIQAVEGVNAAESGAHILGDLVKRLRAA